MKRLLPLGLCLVLLVGALVFTAKQPRSMDDIIRDEPHIFGTVSQVTENAILVEVDPSNTQYKGNFSVWVSLEAEHPDSVTSFRVGDKVCVYFDGMIAETSPGQIHRVYAITLI